MPIHDGNSVRFTADDYPLGSAQRAIADDQQPRATGGATAPSATPSIQQILAGDTDYTRRLNRRLEDAWRDPSPPGGGL